MPRKDVEIVEVKLVAGPLHVLQDGEDVFAVFVGLGARTMAAVFDLQFVEMEAFREFVQCRRVGIGDIEPGNSRRELLRFGHGSTSLPRVPSCPSRERLFVRDS